MFEYENVRQEGQRWGGFTVTGFCVVCCLPFLWLPVCRLPSCVSLYTWLIVYVGVLAMSNFSGQGVVVCKVVCAVLEGRCVLVLFV